MSNIRKKRTLVTMLNNITKKRNLEIIPSNIRNYI